MPRNPYAGPVIAFATAEAWDDWLTARAAGPAGLWLKLAKKGSGIASVTYDEAVEVALRHGWIDGLKRPLDSQYWLQWFVPRRPRSRWSRINREKAEALIAAGRMLPPGLAQVEAARTDGRWAAAYESQRTVTMPDDLRAALAAMPGAAAFFETLNSANRYAILYQVHEAKRPQTRAARIERFVTMCAEGRRIYP